MYTSPKPESLNLKHIFLAWYELGLAYFYTAYADSAWISVVGSDKKTNAGGPVYRQARFFLH